MNSSDILNFSRDRDCSPIYRMTVVPTGNYSATKIYLVGDSVFYEGISYVAIKANEGVLVTNNDYWQELAGAIPGGLKDEVLTKVSDNQYEYLWRKLNKTDIGLNNVDNTADLLKPISTAVQSALNLKEDVGVADSIMDSHKFQYNHSLIETALQSETDPIWNNEKNNYSLTSHNHDAVYQPIGNYLTEETDPIWNNEKNNYSLTSHNHDAVYQPIGNYLTEETDPLFNAWDKSTGISISEIQISDLKNYALESDLTTGLGAKWSLGGDTLSAKKTIGSLNNFDFGILTNNTERITVLSNGNVGIGTTDPGSYKLNIVGSLYASGSAIVNYGLTVIGATGDYPSIMSYTNSDTSWHGLFNSARRSRGSYTSPTAAANGDYVMYYDQWVHDGTNYIRGGQFKSFVDGAVSTGKTPLAWSWTTMDANGNSAVRFKISSSGNVGIGTSNPGYLLDLYNSSSASVSVKNDSTQALLFASSSGYSGFGTQNATDFIIRTNGTERLRILATGNVGIGTTNPDARLKISGGHLALDNNYWIAFRNAANTNNDGVLNYDTNNSLNFNTGGSMYFRHSSTYNMTIDSGGSVGIGTTNPTRNLEVVDVNNTGYPLSLYRPQNGNNYGVIQEFALNNSSGNRVSYADMYGGIFGAGQTAGAENGMFVFRTKRSGTMTEAARIDSNGNVGIGTTSPGYPLEVSGQTKINSLGIGANPDVTGGIRLGERASDMGTIASTGGIFRTSGRISITTATLQNAFNIVDSGNIGIGTTNPNNKLVVSVGGTGGDISMGTPFAQSGIRFGNSNTANVRYNDAGLEIVAGIGTGTPAVGSGLYIKNGGNVGIGTTSPVSRFSVSDTSTATTRGILSGQYNNGANGAQFVGRKSRGTEAAPTTVQSGDYGIGLSADFYDGSSWINPGYFGMIVNGIVGAGSVPSDFYIKTGSSGGGSERLRITSAGNVGIGTSSPAHKLDVVGNINTTGNLSMFNGSTALSAPSAAELRINAGGFGTVTIPNGAFNVRSGALYVSTGNNVGIGITNPDGKLHVMDGSAGTVTAYAGSTLTLESSGANNFLSILSPAGQNQGILFGDSDANWRGQIEYNHANDMMYFYTAAAGGTMVMNNIGNVGIGTTNPTGKLEVAGTGTTDDDVIFKFSMGSNDTSYSATDFRVGSPASSWGGIRFSNPSSNVTNLEFSNWNGSARTVRMGIYGTNGNVGIGTTNPGAKLEVEDTGGLGTTAGNYRLLTRTSATGGVNYFMDNTWLYRNTGGTDWTTTSLYNGISVDTSFLTPGVDVRTWWSRDPNNNIQSWGTAGNTYLTINQGNVGIGTMSPLQKLTVNGELSTGANSYIGINTYYNSGFRFMGNGNGAARLKVESDGRLAICNSNSSATSGEAVISNELSFTRDGNFGIGTIEPNEKLEVNGNIKISGNMLKMTGITTATRDGLTAVAGDIIYNTTTNKHQGYDGTIWHDLY